MSALDALFASQHEVDAGEDELGVARGQVTDAIGQSVRSPAWSTRKLETGHNARMDSHEPDFIVVGDKVALGPLRRDLAAEYARWMNEPEVRCGLNQMGIASPQSQEKWVEDNLERGAK